MRSYFYKLNDTHQLSTPSIAEDEIYKYGLGEASSFKGIRYRKVSDDIVVTKLRSFIPEPYRQEFFPSYMEINLETIPAHTDSGVLCSLNFYIDTGNATTKFFDYQEGVAPSFMKLPNQTDGSIFDESTLESKGSFVASSGDIWALNVKKPHGVYVDKISMRTAYCLQSNTINYHKLLDMLEWQKKYGN